MQLSQLYRRGVVRPLDTVAASQLAEFHIENSIRTEWLPIFGDEHFEMIWKSGIFQRINEACDSYISDYEEIELAVQQLMPALNAVNATPKSESPTVAIFTENLVAMMADAVESHLPLYFVL